MKPQTKKKSRHKQSTLRADFHITIIFTRKLYIKPSLYTTLKLYNSNGATNKTKITHIPEIINTKTTQTSSTVQKPPEHRPNPNSKRPTNPAIPSTKPLRKTPKKIFQKQLTPKKGRCARAAPRTQTDTMESSRKSKRDITR